MPFRQIDSQRPERRRDPLAPSPPRPPRRETHRPLHVRRSATAALPPSLHYRPGVPDSRESARPRYQRCQSDSHTLTARTRCFGAPETLPHPGKRGQLGGVNCKTRGKSRRKKNWAAKPARGYAARLQNRASSADDALHAVQKERPKVGGNSFTSRHCCSRINDTDTSRLLGQIKNIKLASTRVSDND
jgi:hypothetical protein